jgi:hypothetical protein
MFLKLLIKIGVKSLTITGLDSFSNIITKNYVSNDLINIAKLSEIDERNEIMSEELSKFENFIKIDFLTTILYKIKQLYKL